MKEERVKNIALIVAFAALAILATLLVLSKNELNRIANSLTAKDAEIQQLDKDLGISKSSLLSLSDLNKKYKEEIEGFPAKLKKIIDSYELKILSRDRTIAALKNQIAGGTTVVEVKPDTPEGNKVISYQWTDPLSRFRLTDPDIFVPDNENFTYSQYVTVTGHVLYGKDGRLQIRRVELKEVTPSGQDSSGKPTFKPVPGGKMEIVDSTFDYSDLAAKEKSVFDVFHPRVIASLGAHTQLLPPSAKLLPGVGLEIANLGRFIDHANVGINTKLSLDTDNILASRIGAGIAYTVAPPAVDTNLGLGISVSTPSNNLLNEWGLSIDAIFYLTN